jgi:solute carrier family 25 carnitine/acylcarnitine transporter 20/29
MSSSTTVSDAASSSRVRENGKETIATAPKGGNYKGFVGGVFSGIAKLSVGYVVKYRKVCSKD